MGHPTFVTGAGNVEGTVVPSPKPIYLASSVKVFFTSTTIRCRCRKCGRNCSSLPQIHLLSVQREGILHFNYHSLPVQEMWRKLQFPAPKPVYLASSVKVSFTSTDFCGASGSTTRYIFTSACLPCSVITR